LWILRINAACRQRGLRYSQFIHGLAQANVEVNRKMLAHLAIVDPAAFDSLAQVAQGQPESV
jgi:large subunit ribosomal protein L20